MGDLTTCSAVNYNFNAQSYSSQCPFKSHLINQWDCQTTSQFKNIVGKSLQFISDYIFNFSPHADSNESSLIKDSICTYLNNENGQTLINHKWLLISTERYLSSIYYRLAQTLLDAGILPSVKIMDGVTALHVAAGLDNIDAMELLIRAGADINALDDENRTPFDWAILDNSKNALEYLLQTKVNLFYVDNQGATYLHKAAEQSSEAVIAYLIEQGLSVEARDNFAQTPMHWAAIGNNPIGVETLYLKGANVDARDQDDYTPLDVALLAQAKDSMKMLIECKANLSQDSKHPFDRMRFLVISGQNSLVDEFVKAYESSQVDYPSLSSVTIASLKNRNETDSEVLI